MLKLPGDCDVLLFAIGDRDEENRGDRETSSAGETGTSVTEQLAMMSNAILLKLPGSCNMSSFLGLLGDDTSLGPSIQQFLIICYFSAIKFVPITMSCSINV